MTKFYQFRAGVPGSVIDKKPNAGDNDFVNGFYSEGETRA